MARCSMQWSGLCAFETTWIIRTFQLGPIFSRPCCTSLCAVICADLPDHASVKPLQAWSVRGVVGLEDTLGLVSPLFSQQRPTLLARACQDPLWLVGMVHIDADVYTVLACGCASRQVAIGCEGAERVQAPQIFRGHGGVFRSPEGGQRARGDTAAGWRSFAAGDGCLQREESLDSGRQVRAAGGGDALSSLR